MAFISFHNCKMRLKGMLAYTCLFLFFDIQAQAQVLDFPGRHAPVQIGSSVFRGPYACPRIYCTLDNRNCRNPVLPCWSLRRPISFASCDCLPIILPPRGVAGK